MKSNCINLSDSSLEKILWILYGVGDIISQPFKVYGENQESKHMISGSLNFYIWRWP